MQSYRLLNRLRKILIWLRPDVGNLLVLHNDIVVGETIRRTGVWAAQDVKLFSRLVAPGMLVVDVGANIGHHTVLFSKLVGNNGYVIGFEPQERPFRLLDANLSINRCENARAFRHALGASSADVFMRPTNYEKPNNFAALPIARNEGE
jgi:predicted methyltransferase